jgi:hypothetical protein
LALILSSSSTVSPLRHSNSENALMTKVLKLGILVTSSSQISISYGNNKKYNNNKKFKLLLMKKESELISHLKNWKPCNESNK